MKSRAFASFAILALVACDGRKDSAGNVASAADSTPSDNHRPADEATRLPSKVSDRSAAPDTGSEKFGTLSFEVANFVDGVEVSSEKVPVAEAVPGRPGFIYSPYDGQVIDATGKEPGAVIEDPGSSADDPRYIVLPGEVSWRPFTGQPSARR